MQTKQKMSMAFPNCLRQARRSPFPSSLPSFLIFSSLVGAAVFALFSLNTVVENLGSRARTVIGHNLEPTPWHTFEPAPHPHSPATIFRCSYLSCRSLNPFSSPSSPKGPSLNSLKRRPKKRRSCPYFFRFIHRDLEPWKRSKISPSMLAEAKKQAAMRISIVDGRLYVDLYYACVQSRAMFTIWSLLQLLRRFPGMVPDVDMMFDCMDKPSVEREKYYSGGGGNPGGLPPAPPLFRYCTTKDHLDIPFPDWSFWGWSEVNIKPWDEEFRDIKLGSQAMTWKQKDATAYWKGNPDVSAPIRTALLNCNDTKMWGAQIMRQNWVEEASNGFEKSKLANQCDHRYKIYAEGYAWSVSLKYILACGSLSLIIDPQYKDFFSRGLIPKTNYWPIGVDNLCQNIKSTVDWGNEHPSEAEAVGKKAQELMEELDMDRVYDYMYHLILEYSKLQDFKPTPPPASQEMCLESVLCLATEQQRQFLESSLTSPTTYVPCALSEP